MPFQSCLLVIIAFVNVDIDTQTQIVRDVEAFEQSTLLYIESLGTDKEKPARAAMEEKRRLVVSHGSRAIEPLTKLFTHKQVNVRRGTAITLLLTIERHGIDDEKLLDKVLLRMIEDPDIKCRSNLYHVVKAIIANIKKRNKSVEKSRPTRHGRRAESPST